MPTTSQSIQYKVPCLKAQNKNVQFIQKPGFCKIHGNGLVDHHAKNTVVSKSVVDILKLKYNTIIDIKKHKKHKISDKITGQTKTQNHEK